MEDQPQNLEPQIHESQKPDAVSQESNTKLNAYDDGTVTYRDDDLKAYLDENVSCVDFGISHGEPGLTLELNCGGFEWKPVDVLTPRMGESMKSRSENSVLSVEELTELDTIVYEDHEVTGAPGVILRQGSMNVWTPIATRTRSRLKLSDIPFSY